MESYEEDIGDELTNISEPSKGIRVTDGVFGGERVPIVVFALTGG